MGLQSGMEWDTARMAVGEANVPLRYRDVQHRGATLGKLKSKSTHLLFVSLSRRVGRNYDRSIKMRGNRTLCASRRERIKRTPQCREKIKDELSS